MILLWSYGTYYQISSYITGQDWQTLSVGATPSGALPVYPSSTVVELMHLWRNVPHQKIVVFAWDTVAGTPKTGDAANITALISVDDRAWEPAAMGNPTELSATSAPGFYSFELTKEETDCDLLVLKASSSTSASITIKTAIRHTQEKEFSYTRRYPTH